MNLTRKSRGGKLRWLVVAACVPMIGLLIGGVLIAARELKAGSKLQGKLNELKQAGLPYNNASFYQWYRSHTHSEGTHAWVEVLESVSATEQLGAINQLPLVGQGKELSELKPNVEWKEEPKVKEYLTEMQGMLRKVHQLKQFPAPVTLPIEFQGAGTLLPHFQQARAVTRLLQLDFEYAFYHKEFDRAMQDLSSIRTVAQAIDNDLFLVVDLIAAASLQTQYHEIQRSLVTDAWPPEKLKELRQSLGGVRQNAAKWKSLFVCERALFCDDVASGDLARLTNEKHSSLLPLLNTGRLHIFEAYDELIEAGNRELAAIKSASRSAMGRLINRDATLDVDGGDVWIKLLLPSVEGIAKAHENEESNRRLTLTAVALRQFKHQEGRWPIRLNELEKVGLTTTDYSTVNRGEFGYQLKDEVAYLWGSDPYGDSSVPSVRPNIGPDSSVSPVLVTLR